MREKTNITKPVYRYRTDSGQPTCVWDWDEDEVCEHYQDNGIMPPHCGWCGPGENNRLYLDSADWGRVIPCDGCPLWAPEVEVLP